MPPPCSVPSDPAVSLEDVVFHYGDRCALSGVSFRVAAGEIFGLLGPNGGGKTTLFRILSTASVPSSGTVCIFGTDVVRNPRQVRPQLGVVFQAPSLDKKLTAFENMMHHGHLYGLSGPALRAQIDEMLDRVGLSDRANERIERLSGGMQRRVEVAKGLLHRPKLMIMDEPSTGLDPGARRDLWEYLKRVRDRDGLTILLTTHLMDEAALCDRVAIIDVGKLIALGTPNELASEIGGAIVTLEVDDPSGLAGRIRTELGVGCTVFEKSIRIERDRGHDLVAQLFDAFPGRIHSVTVRQPSLEDVFVRKTGHRFWDAV